MGEIRVTSEVAGRVCAISLEAGSSVSGGQDILLVEAMKMEIPVTAPSGGTLASLLVKVDDMISEGQAVAVIRTV